MYTSDCVSAGDGGGTAGRAGTGDGGGSGPAKKVLAAAEETVCHQYDIERLCQSHRPIFSLLSVFYARTRHRNKLTS